MCCGVGGARCLGLGDGSVLQSVAGWEHVRGLWTERVDTRASSKNREQSKIVCSFIR